MRPRIFVPPSGYELIYPTTDKGKVLTVEADGRVNPEAIPGPSAYPGDDAGLIITVKPDGTVLPEPPGQIPVAFAEVPPIGSVSLLTQSVTRFNAGMCLSSLNDDTDNLYTAVTADPSAWVTAGAVTVAKGFLGPYSNLEAYQMTCAANAATFEIPVTPGSYAANVGTYGFEVHLKAGTYGGVLQFRTCPVAGVPQAVWNVDLTAGTLSPSNNQLSAYFPDQLVKVENGWLKFTVYVWAPGNVQDVGMTIQPMTSTTGQIFYMWHPRTFKPRVTDVDRFILGAQVPAVGQMLDLTGTNALDIEHSSAGCTIDGATAEATWATGGAFTLLWCGRLSSTRAFTAGDGVIVKAKPNAGNNRFEFGLRTVSGTNYHYCRQVVGASDISSVSTTPASYAPTCRAIVCNGTTVQWYADGVPDGAPQPFALQALAATIMNMGNASGDWFHQLGDVVPFNRALNPDEVYEATKEVLTGIHGIPMGPWDIFHMTGQSNASDRGLGSLLPIYLKGDPWCGAPYQDMQQISFGPSVTTQSDGLQALVGRASPSRGPLFADFNIGNFSVQYSAVRYLIERGRKIAVNRYWMSGQSIVMWNPTLTPTYGLCYAPFVARCQLMAQRIAVPSRHWCMVFEQGEGDSGPGITAQNYANNLAAFIPQLRIDLNAPNLRVLQPHLSNNQWAWQPYSYIVNQGMDLYALQDPKYEIYSNDNVQYNDDGSHLLTQGTLESGIRIGKKAILYP